MVDTLLLIHLAFAFVVGSLWVTAITVIAEKWGNVVGGILGGVPSTSAFSFFFIGLNQSPAAAAASTTDFPLAFAITSAYLFFYAYFAQKGFRRGILLSLLIWFAVSTVIVLAGLDDFVFTLTSGTVISILTYVAFSKKLWLKNLQGTQKLYKPSEILLRGTGAGSLVAAAVVLSQIGGPILGGIAAAFPALFTSTLIILNRSRGTEFSRSMTKPLVYSGILTIIPYSVAVRFLYPVLGVWVGTLVCYGLVLPLAALSYILLKHQIPLQRRFGMPRKNIALYGTRLDVVYEDA